MPDRVLLGSPDQGRGYHEASLVSGWFGYRGSRSGWSTKQGDGGMVRTCREFVFVDLYVQAVVGEVISQRLRTRSVYRTMRNVAAPIRVSDVQWSMSFQRHDLTIANFTFMAVTNYTEGRRCLWYTAPIRLCFRLFVSSPLRLFVSPSTIADRPILPTVEHRSSCGQHTSIAPRVPSVVVVHGRCKPQTLPPAAPTLRYYFVKAWLMVACLYGRRRRVPQLAFAATEVYPSRRRTP